VKGFIRGSLWLIGIVGAICLLLHILFFDTWVVPDNDPLLVASILPTLYPNDRILTARRSTPTSGQLARCASPEPGSEYVIGRVMGTSGDTVLVDNGRVSINGKMIASRHGCGRRQVLHPITQEQVTLSCATEDNGAWTFEYLVPLDRPDGQRTAVVEQGKLFLVSDNRAIHKDSRDFGLIDATTCEHVVFRLWGDSFVDTSRRFTVLY
jgi:signal peptidase I